MVTRIFFALWVGVVFLTLGCAPKKNSTGASQPLKAASAKVEASVMSAVERQYLVWFLLQREKLGLPKVSVRHLKTLSGSCEDCLVIFYAGGATPTIVRVEVSPSGVASARDSEGYNYLTQTRGEPESFSEVSP